MILDVRCQKRAAIRCLSSLLRYLLPSRKPSVMLCKNVLIGILCIPVGLTYTNIATAQYIDLEFTTPSQITLAFDERLKRSRISANLSELESGVVNIGAIAPFATVLSNSVLIEAIANVSADTLLEDLTDLGLQRGTAFGMLVSGMFPISAISSAEFLQSMRFMRLAVPFKQIGAADNFADQAMRSDDAKAELGLSGAGISIGILSDSYNNLGGEQADIASGDLPDNVIVLDDTATGGNSDEGRAMAQLIHDIAPGANLLFHTAFNGAPDFAQGILDLRAAGADVIVDDIGYLGQPFFQDGVIAQAVDQVVADGAAYFSAAGNSGAESYEAAYSDSGLSAPADFSINGLTYSLGNFHTVDPNDPNGIAPTFTLPPGAELFMAIQWDQPFASSGGSGATTDLDVLLIDESQNILAIANDNNILSGDAAEILFYRNRTGATQNVGLMIGVFAGPLPGLVKWINLGTSVEFASGTIPASFATVFAHPNAEGAIAVGAAYYQDTPEFGVSPPEIESFSSRGGIEILFDTSGNRLSNPVDRNKPDIVAPDGTDTTFFGRLDADNSGFPDFFGTSAAAPHAAAVAALQLECSPSLSPADVRRNQFDHAIDMDIAGFDNISGPGLIDAFTTLTETCTPVVTTCNGLAITVDLNLGQKTTPNDDVVLGTPGNDNIRGKGGNDTICGLGGDDIIFGDSGNDWIDGGDGIDTIRGGNGADVLFAGAGATVGTVSRVLGGAGNDRIFGGPDADDLRGGPGEDIISGGQGADLILGNADDDVLSGGGGADTLRGGGGENDQLFGEGGRDSLNGNSGGNDFCDDGGQEGDTKANCESFPPAG